MAWAGLADRAGPAILSLDEPSVNDAAQRADGPDFEACGGLLPAIAQDAATGQVLMLAYMNEEAFQETLRTGQAVYFSRSRQRLWRKGEESGHVQRVVAVYVDCDRDTILLRVEQTGAACHEGYATCFFREATPEGLRIVAERLVDPQQVYSNPHHPPHPTPTP